MSFHTGCPIPHGRQFGDRRYDWQDAEEAAYPINGLRPGMQVVRADNPAVGLLLHVCSTERAGGRKYHGYVLFAKGGRRGDKRYDVHRHVALPLLREATPGAIAVARATYQRAVETRALRVGKVLCDPT